MKVELTLGDDSDPCHMMPCIVAILYKMINGLSPAGVTSLGNHISILQTDIFSYFYVFDTKIDGYRDSSTSEGLLRHT